jgi:hypothetical protein
MNDVYKFFDKDAEFASDPRFVHIIKNDENTIKQNEWSGRIQNIRELIDGNMRKLSI